MVDRKDRIRIQIGGQEFSVVGGSFQDMLAAVKQINGRRFVSELKVWQAPGPVEEVQRQLEISGYQLEGGAPAASAPPAQTSPTGAAGDRIRVLVGGQRLAVVGGGFQDMLAVVKGLPDRRFDGETKLWEISGDPGVIKGMIEAAGFQLEGAAKIPVGPVPPMEPPDFFSERGGRSVPPMESPDFLSERDSRSAPSFQSSDFFDDDFEPPESPPWLDDERASSPPEDNYFDQPYEDESSPATTRPAPTGPALASGSRRGGGGDRIRIRLGDMPLVVSGGEFQAMLALIKSIPGRRFNGDERIWELPETGGLEALEQRVVAAGFVLENG